MTIDRNTVINASATSSGTGGKVIVWSDEKTSFAGTILATGGPAGGDGGFAEVSGHLLDFKGAVDLHTRGRMSPNRPDRRAKIPCHGAV